MLLQRSVGPARIVSGCRTTAPELSSRSFEVLGGQQPGFPDPLAVGMTGVEAMPCGEPFQLRDPDGRGLETDVRDRRIDRGLVIALRGLAVHGPTPSPQVSGAIAFSLCLKGSRAANRMLEPAC